MRISVTCLLHREIRAFLPFAVITVCIGARCPTRRETPLERNFARDQYHCCQGFNLVNTVPNSPTVNMEDPSIFYAGGVYHVIYHCWSTGKAYFWFDTLARSAARSGRVRPGVIGGSQACKWKNEQKPRTPALHAIDANPASE